MTGSWAEIFSLLKKWRWRELLYKPTDNATLQFLRYIIVGGCAFVTDFCTVWLLKELGLHYLVAGVFGFILGVVVNYILSKTLAFSGKRANMSREAEFALFIVISLIGLGLTELLMWVFTDTAELVNLSYRLMMILAVCYIAMAVTQSLSGIMRGAGDTMTPMWISLITTVAIRVPVAYGISFLTRTPELPYGRFECICVSLLCSWILGMLLNVYFFRKGKWKTKAIG